MLPGLRGGGKTQSHDPRTRTGLVACAAGVCSAVVEAGQARQVIENAAGNWGLSADETQELHGWLVEVKV
jgi:hypothetical protein